LKDLNLTVEFAQSQRFFKDFPLPIENCIDIDMIGLNQEVTYDRLALTWNAYEHM